MVRKTQSFLFGLMTGIALLCVSLPAMALTVEVKPGSQNVLVGDTTVVDLVITGLGDFGSPSLGVFDIDVSFDASILALDTTDTDWNDIIDNVALDPTGQLDLLGLRENFAGAALTGPGTLNLFDLSFDSPLDLEDFQAPAFTLATLTFDAIGPGTSRLDVFTQSWSLGDAWGDPLTVDIIKHGSINVTPAPEPTTLLLFGTGLMSLTGMLRKKSKKGPTPPQAAGIKPALL